MTSCPLIPNLDGAAAERFLRVARRLAAARLENAELAESEAQWARSTPALNGQALRFEASVRLLVDLVGLRWQVVEDRFGLELRAPYASARLHSPTAIRESKDIVRRELQPVLAQQFADPSVRKFINSVEQPSARSGRKSIRHLIADGAEVHARIATDGAAGVDPYLQLVPVEGDEGGADEFTRLALGDVWRYFRYTWSIPATPTPGRQLLYLVRDRRHPSHAVMGIAALNNAALQSPVRDDAIGWSTDAFSRRLGALEEEDCYREVNSVFGEGFSPKFRKLRNGIVLLGFNASLLMRHDQSRRIYAAPLWAGADFYLRGESDTRPGYASTSEAFGEATASIASWWRERWLTSRLAHAPALAALRQTKPWLLSALWPETPARESLFPSPTPSPAVATTPASDPAQFWRELAAAGPESCADELSPADLARLHVDPRHHDLEKFLREKLSAGFSLVLTGNAGDGKTHLLKRLHAELNGTDVEGDATAAMEPEDVGTILARWRAAHAAGRPFHLAANEYPLHLLRQTGRGFAPIDEVDRQCRHRLAYSTEPESEETARERVLVVDLSLRNPLHEDFLDPLPDHLLRRPEIREAVAAERDGDLARNLARLGDGSPTASRVRERLRDLFRLLVSAGERATVRELWIWMTRLLFGDGTSDRLPSGSAERTYSERLFARDERFALSAALRRLADPARHSHPRWDWRLETRRTEPADWAHGRPDELLRLQDRATFTALKRRFFFEHAHGVESFALDGTPGRDLFEVLRDPARATRAFLQNLVAALNGAFCPVPFPEMRSDLYLWVGHRYHEQPSRGHVANQSLCFTDLRLCLPRLPARIVKAFAYQADHVRVEYVAPSGFSVCLVSLARRSRRDREPRACLSESSHGHSPRDGAFRLRKAALHVRKRTRGAALPEPTP